MKGDEPRDGDEVEAELSFEWEAWGNCEEGGDEARWNRGQEEGADDVEDEMERGKRGRLMCCVCGHWEVPTPSMPIVVESVALMNGDAMDCNVNDEEDNLESEEPQRVQVQAGVCTGKVHAVLDTAATNVWLDQRTFEEWGGI